MTNENDIEFVKISEYNVLKEKFHIRIEELQADNEHLHRKCDEFYKNNCNLRLEINDLLEKQKKVDVQIEQLYNNQQNLFQDTRMGLAQVQDDIKKVHTNQTNYGAAIEKINSAIKYIYRVLRIA